MLVRRDSIHSSLSSILSSNCAPEAETPTLITPGSALTRSLCTRSQRCAWWVAENRAFSIFTALLTVWALLADDIRLLATSKPADSVFDGLTIATMLFFALEIVASCLRRDGYFLGMLFWLELLATASMLLDVSTVAELLFGDTLSSLTRKDVDLGNASGAGQPLDSTGTQTATREARRSRMGAQVGRIFRLVRLVRIVRLIRLVSHVWRRHTINGLQKSSLAGPGTTEWDDDDYDRGVGDNDRDMPESAISRTLWEMTVQRVVLVQLAIAFGLHLFNPSIYVNDSPSSAQFGLDELHRLWWRGVERFSPSESAAQLASYLASNDRTIYLEDFYRYIFYHNPFCTSDTVPPNVASPLDSLSQLFWLGAGPANSALASLFFPRAHRSSDALTLNECWSGKRWRYFQCDLTSDPEQFFAVPWNSRERCLSGLARGISFLAPKEPWLRCPGQLRFEERVVLYPSGATNAEWSRANLVVVLDRRRASRIEALLNMLRTLYVCLVLAWASMTFSSDAGRFALKPIERMIARIELIRHDPLVALHTKRRSRSLQRGRILEFSRSASSRSQWITCISQLWRRQYIKEEPEPMETVMLEKTIVKIGSLLALGFGEAGVEIICHNLLRESGATLNAMIPGSRVDAIFGFCDILHFTDTTEVLQDEVMVFVNRIAHIVHTCVKEFFGSPNKNMGSAFLLVWRLSGQSAKKQQRLADMALIALIKIVAQIAISPTLSSYRVHHKLLKRLPRYRVRMGFGLHSGWAIEGAIGSEFKVDASYLGPNVNLTTRLQICSHTYGCRIVASAAAACLMSDAVREECRLIDHVRMHGTRRPTKIYSLDLDEFALDDAENLEILDNEEPWPLPRWTCMQSRRLALQKQWNRRWSDSYEMHSMFEEDMVIRTMRQQYLPEFFCRFNMAFLNYEAGEWDVAEMMLQYTRDMLNEPDGPSVALLRYVSSFDGMAPKGWKGYRVHA